MPKKDTASAVLGMLSTTGAQTRPPLAAPLPPEPAVPSQPPPQATPTSAAIETKRESSGSVSTLPAARESQARAEEPAPRTLRLRPDTAAQLRAAWLEAKREDVLLTAQDFASNLVDDALTRLRRRRVVVSS
ncbi:MAG: hypothetical protein QOG75_7048 [Mycobacterium sp.]|jgi:hypothetical protein|nr:hypothetical protein [Mycobacterium sp.]